MGFTSLVNATQTGVCLFLLFLRLARLSAYPRLTLSSGRYSRVLLPGISAGMSVSRQLQVDGDGDDI